MAAACGCGTGIPLFNLTAGLFIEPIETEFGWSRSAVTIVPIISTSIALGSLPTGYLIDRWGSRKVALSGLAALSLAIIAYSFVPPNAVAFYGLTLVIGLISSTVAFGPFSKAVATWFRSGLGSAIGLTLSGPSIISLIAIPLIAATIQHYGWRAGYLALAAFPLVLGLPMTALFFREQQTAPASAEGTAPELVGHTLREAIRDWRYWTLLVIMSVATIPLGGFMVHLQPLLAGKSIAVAEAAGLGMLYALSMTGGRLIGGFLLDKYEPHAVAALLFCIAGGGALLVPYVPSDPATVLIALPIVLIAIGSGAEGDYLAFFTQKFFGTRSYAMIVGSLSAAGALCTGLGAFLFAAIFDHTQSYALACLIGGACFVIGGVLTLAMGLAYHRGNQLERRFRSSTS